MTAEYTILLRLLSLIKILFVPLFLVTECIRQCQIFSEGNFDPYCCMLSDRLHLLPDSSLRDIQEHDKVKYFKDFICDALSLLLFIYIFMSYRILCRFFWMFLCFLLLFCKSKWYLSLQIVHFINRMKAYLPTSLGLLKAMTLHNDDVIMLYNVTYCNKP